MKRFEDLAFVNGSFEVVDTSWGPVKIGVYSKFLEKWLQYFPLSQLLFISGERLIVDPAFEIGRAQVSSLTLVFRRQDYGLLQHNRVETHVSLFSVLSTNIDFVYKKGGICKSECNFQKQHICFTE